MFQLPDNCLRAKSNFCARRGSSYLLVLCVSMIIALIGLSGLIAARIEYEMATTTSDAASARSYAISAIEMGLYEIDADPLNWRKSFDGGTMPTDMPIGDGTMTLQAMDPVDADMLSNITDPIRLTGIGAKGNAIHKVQVTVIFVNGMPDFMPGSWKQIVD